MGPPTKGSTKADAKAETVAASTKADASATHKKTSASAGGAAGSAVNVAKQKRQAKDKEKEKEAAPAPDPAALKASDPSEAAAKGKAKAKAKGKAKAKAKPGEQADGAAEEVTLEAAEMSLEEEIAKQLKEKEDAEFAEELAKLDAADKDVDVKQWVTILCDATQETNKVLVSCKINVDDLRRSISRFACCKPRELVFSIKGHECVEARECPLKNPKSFDAEKDVIRWWRGDRLKRVLKKRQLATMNNLDKMERSVLHFVCMDGDYDLTEEVVRDTNFKYSLVNKQDVFGDTALHYACIMGYSDIVELLLDSKGDPECQNINRRTPTHLASEHGHGSVMRSLLRNGATIGSNPGNCWKYPNATWFATHNGRQKVIKEIAQKQAEDRAMDELNAQMEAELAAAKEDDSGDD